MRFIDADKFKKELSAMCIQFNFDIEKVTTMFKIIDAQPTAYNVDKVVEQIRLLRHPYTTFPEGFGDLNAYDFYINKAIEIVKGGGQG